MSFWSCGLFRCCEHHLPEDECFADAQSGAEVWVARANALGLDYRRDCAEKLYLGETDCSVLEQRERYYWGCEEVCAVFHGDAALGEPCELVGLHMSSCAKDLVCGADEVCHAPCDAPELALAGQRCGAALGLDCIEGLACAASGRCVSAVALGSACGPEQPCDAEGWCAASNLCEAKVADAQPCEQHEQCLSRLCELGGCVAPTMQYCVNPVL